MPEKQLPKLKNRLGLVVVLAKPSGAPDGSAAKLTIAYRNDIIGFRNATGVHEALCITPSGHDPNYDGLHLSAPVAHGFAVDLVGAAAKLGTALVSVNNHVDHELNEWHSFSPADAKAIAFAVESSLRRAGK